MSGLHCQAHPGEHYTNFCTALPCLHPLCPECIDDHVTFHKGEKSHCEVASIINVKRGCEKKIQTGINILIEKLKLPQLISLQNPDHYHQLQMQQIKIYKQKLNSIIDDHCEALLKHIEANSRTLSSQSQVVGHIKSVLQQFQGFHDSLLVFHTYKKKEAHEKSKEAIEREDQALENLRKVCQLDVKSLIDRLQIDIKKECKDILVLQFNENTLSQFANALKSIITVRNEDFKAVFEEYKSRSPSPIDAMSISSSGIKEKFPNLSPIMPRLVQNNQDLLTLKMPNYFLPKAQRKLMHFLKLNDKTLYELDLGQNSTVFRPVEMNIPFTVPLFFCSVITPQGDIYLLGGSQSSQKLQQIYCYEHINRSLMKCGKLITARSSFSTCVMYPYIYSFCGLSPDGMTRCCERYHILNQQSEALPDSNYAGIAPAVASFNKSIYKFGGNLEESGEQVHVIERLTGNVWTDLKIQSAKPFSFHQFGAASQINPNELIVFGGYDRDNEGYSQSFLVKVSESVEVTETWPLPQAEGFWSSQSVWFDGKLFILQNVELPLSHDVDESQRGLLMLTVKGWVKLN